MALYSTAGVRFVNLNTLAVEAVSLPDEEFVDLGKAVRLCGLNVFVC